MIINRSMGIRTFSLLWLLALVTVSFWGWLYLWDGGLFSELDSLQKYLLYNEFLLVGILFGLGGKRHASGPHREFVEAVRRSGRQALFGLFAIFGVVFAVQDTGVSRSFFFSYVPCLLLTLLFCNYLVPIWLGRWAFSGDRRERVALAGTAEQANQLKPWLERKGLLGMHTVGLVCPSPAAGNGTTGNGYHTNSSSLPVLGSIDAMGDILKKSSITQLIVLDLSLGPEQLSRLTQLCDGAAVRMLALHDLDSYFNHTTMTFEDDGMRFIGLRDEPLESPVNRSIKRAMDVAIALPVTLFLLPFAIVLVSLLQRLQSPGPVFFRQMRVGMMGRPFQMIKFRTMHVNRDDEARQASKDDERIYSAGRWFRKLSIDELPQFINVLKGDMSIVGPRPHLEKHEDLWIRAMRKYVVRRFIRPGITGEAQVKGLRGEVHTEADILKRVEADIHYLENWSFTLDCAIILKTAQHCVLPPQSAY
jgi:exopolysaccharide biosynthesis polyprenyl glycosylphosphotransferase